MACDQNLQFHYCLGFSFVAVLELALNFPKTFSASSGVILQLDCLPMHISFKMGGFLVQFIQTNCYNIFYLKWIYFWKYCNLEFMVYLSTTLYVVDFIGDGSNTFTSFVIAISRLQHNFSFLKKEMVHSLSGSNMMAVAYSAA